MHHTGCPSKLIDLEDLVMHHKGCPNKLINLGTPTKDEEGGETGWVVDKELIGEHMGRDHRQLAESSTMANH